jgi:hypothetical protein
LVRMSDIAAVVINRFMAHSISHGVPLMPPPGEY